MTTTAGDGDQSDVVTEECRGLPTTARLGGKAWDRFFLRLQKEPIIPTS